MARKPRIVSVYERINDKQSEIKDCENTLKKLNEELQILFDERDNLEMKQLFDQMKTNGLDITKAMKLLQVNK